MPRTLDEVRRHGMEALRDRLGWVDMMRFLQQCETGSDDDARERQSLADETSLEEVERQASADQAG